MSAIEMMDPKMDAGMLCNQIQRKVLNFSAAVEVCIQKLYQTIGRFYHYTFIFKLWNKRCINGDMTKYNYNEQPFYILMLTSYIKNVILNCQTKEVKIEDLTIEELVGIMDATMACMVSFVSMCMWCDI